MAVICAALVGFWATAVQAAAMASTGAPPDATGGGAPDAAGAYRVAQALPPQCVELMNSKPEDLAAQLEWFKELNACIASNSDGIAPLLEIEAPDVVDAGAESYVISGYVGDDGSVPTLTINGEPVELVPPGPDAPDLGANTLAFSLTFPVNAEKGNSRFVFEAVDANGNGIAEEREVQLVAANRPKYKGDYYALIIGNGEYDFLPPLETAVSDANAVAETLRTRYVFEAENMRVITNATRREVLSTFAELKKTLNRDDRLVIYYSGRGYIDEVTGVGFWQGTDADEFDDFTWISIDTVTRNLAGMQAKHILVLVDSAFPIAAERGTALAQTTGTKSGGSLCSANDRFFNEKDSWATRKVITSGVLAPIPNDASGGRSVFANQLIQVLEENRDCYIMSKQLFDRLSRGMSETSDQKPELGTIFNTGDEGSGEFALILRAKPLTAAAD